MSSLMWAVEGSAGTMYLLAHFWIATTIQGKSAHQGTACVGHCAEQQQLYSDNLCRRLVV